MQGMFYMITDSANRQKTHFSPEMRSQRHVEALQNDTYLLIREWIWDKEKRIAGEETQGSKVYGERWGWGWGGDGESDGERHKGGQEGAPMFRLRESEGGGCAVGNRLLLKKHTWVMKEKGGVQERKQVWLIQIESGWEGERETEEERKCNGKRFQTIRIFFFFFFTPCAVGEDTNFALKWTLDGNVISIQVIYSPLLKMFSSKWQRPGEKRVMAIFTQCNDEWEEQAVEKNPPPKIK